MAKRGPRAGVPGSGTSAATAGTKKVHCAAYTRKSTEEGLDQAFNSLDAQREACASFTLAQRHEGWTLVPTLYDDGGYSGGSMERPALKRLLADVEAGLVDVVVVYKVDRLTRSLGDFAKIVEVLDARGAGPVPPGYDVAGRSLVVNEAEAATVRLIYQRHRALGTIGALVADLVYRGVVTKRRTMRDGRVVGRQPFLAGSVTHLLRSPLYTGHIPHGDRVYPGQHDAIVAQAEWAASKSLLDGAAPRPRTGQVSPLAGRLTDEHGRHMSPEHANKGGRRYRYYVSRLDPEIKDRAWRLPAGDLEAAVRGAVAGLLAHPQRVAAELGQITQLTAELQQRCTEQLERIASDVGLASSLEVLAGHVAIGSESIRIMLSRSALGTLIGCAQAGGDDADVLTLEVPVSHKRRGHELRLVYAAPDARASERDPRLVQLVASGRAAYDALLAGGGNDDAVRRSHLTRLARLRFLAPDIVLAIVEGRQPDELTARTLMRIPELPLDWRDQRRVLGFD